MLKLNGVDQEFIKDSNKKNILNLLYKKRELTKQEISKEVHISIPTVISNVNELISEGLVEEAGVADSTGGRKPVIVRFLPDSRYSFGVEFSKQSIKVVLTNLDSKIIWQSEFEIGSYEDLNLVMDKVYEIITNALEVNGISRGNLLGIGFSLPGTVDEENLVLEAAPNINLEEIDFNRILSKFDVPIFIENEANAAAYAELTLGIAKEMKNLVYISVAEGIGTGIVIQDYLYKGKNKRAGEFGHMTVVPHGKKCNCGRNGCWELYASGRALLESYNETSQIKVNRLKDFLLMLNEKNSKALEVWSKYIDYLALGIQNIIMILDPHYIILGGEISQLDDVLFNQLKEKIYVKNSFYGVDDVKIIQSKLGENSSILGASLLPMQRLFFFNEKII